LEYDAATDTWAAPQILTDDSQSVTFTQLTLAANGNIYLSYDDAENSELHVLQSTDGGATFQLYADLALPANETGVPTRIVAPEYSNDSLVVLAEVPDANNANGHDLDSYVIPIYSPVTAPPAIPGNVDEWLLADGQWYDSAGPDPHPSGSEVAGIGDFTNDGISDILWYNASTGDVDEWQMAGAAWNGSIDLGAHPGTGWQIAGVGDFTANGTDDVLWTNSSNGDVETDIWELSNGQWANSVSAGSHPAGYQVAGIGDFNGNNTGDILWYDPGTGDVDDWQILNGQWAASVDLGAHPGTGWQIAGIGDFTGNGTDDILWTNASSGEVQTDIWVLSNGNWSNSVSPGAHPAGYQVVGIGDFTGSGTSGILWYNASTGDVDEWQISNGQWAGSVDLGSHPGTDWQVAGVGDFTGTGTSDILWHTGS
jgi:hypothetical protein